MVSSQEMGQKYEFLCKWVVKGSSCGGLQISSLIIRGETVAIFS